MSLAEYKAQARRLQTFLKDHPAQAASLAQGKHASCLEAVAAVHGARNWNTLQAGDGPPSTSAVPETTAAPELAPQGSVEYVCGRSGAGKSFQTILDLADWVGKGGTATVLDVGRSYHHLALALNGVSTTPDTADAAVKLPRAELATFEFEGWQLTTKVLGHDKNPISRRWARALPHVQARTGSGKLLVVDELFMFTCIFKEHLHLLQDFLVQARANGTRIRLLAQSASDFDPYRAVLPPDTQRELTRPR